MLKCEMRPFRLGAGVLLIGCSLLIAGEMENRAQDPIREFRSEFSSYSFGEPPLLDHFEKLYQESAKPKDFERLRTKLIRSDRFKNWSVSEDTVCRDTDPYPYCELEFKSPDGQSVVRLSYATERNREIPGLELYYERPFNTKEQVLLPFMDPPYKCL